MLAFLSSSIADEKLGRSGRKSPRALYLQASGRKLKTPDRASSNDSGLAVTVTRLLHHRKISQAHSRFMKSYEPEV